MTALETAWHDRLELAGCVAVGVGEQDLVAREQLSAAAVGKLEAGVVAQAIDSRQHEIARAWRHVAGE